MSTKRKLSLFTSLKYEIEDADELLNKESGELANEQLIELEKERRG